MGGFAAPAMGIAFSVVMVVLGLEFGDSIITAAQSVLDNGYIANFIGLSPVAKVIPTFYYLGVLGLAGSIATVSGMSIYGQVRR